MKHNWSVLLSCWLAAGLAFSQDPGFPDDIDPNVEVEEAILELESYSMGFELGKMEGSYFFEFYFINDCTFLTINSAEVRHWLDYLDVVFSRPNVVNPNTHGYRTGWVVGYLSEYHKAYGTCQNELNENVRRALAERVRQCETYAAQAVKDMRVDSILNLVPGSKLKDKDVEELIGLVYFGSSSQAWEQLKSIDSAAISKLPCSAVMVDAVKNYLKARLSP